MDGWSDGCWTSVTGKESRCGCPSPARIAIPTPEAFAERRMLMRRNGDVFGPTAVAVTLFFLLVGTGVCPLVRLAAEDTPRQSDAVGNPLAAGMMKLLEQEIDSSLESRGIRSQFDRFQQYAADKLDSTARRRGYSELSGRCRSAWYDHLLRSPEKSPREAERFTRELHEAVTAEGEAVREAIGLIAAKLELDGIQPSTAAEELASVNPIEMLKESLVKAHAEFDAALSPLSSREIAALRDSLYTTFTGRNEHGHTVVDRTTGRRLCDLLEKVDQSRLFAAASALARLSSPDVLEQLASIESEGEVMVEGATGKLIRQVATPSGGIVIGGPEGNTYQLDQMQNVAIVVDLGGDDVYHEGTVGTERPVLIVIDLQGDDQYRGAKPGVQGSAILGVSMLVDKSGNDVYTARDVAQGSCLGGVGMLIDYQGDDSYTGLRRLQGHAIGGLGLLIDRGGNDRYRAAMWAQGFGGPCGVGLLDDLDGQDHYYAGGLYLDSYDESPGYEGWAQGVGAGLRQVANGGIGLIMDGGGDDTYEFDYMGHGGGYWLGVGIARDFGGNDRRLGATEKAYDGKARSQRRFQRFGNGFGCHYALGFCFDDLGDDTYDGTVMGTGFGWDLSVGVLCDFGGNDRYQASGEHTQGSGAQASLGILYDYGGDDVFLGTGQGYASSRISYHSLPRCGGNFGFVVNYGGTDTYGSGVKDNSYSRRGSDGGFVIDRATHDEAERVVSGDSEAEPAASGP